MFKIVVAPFVIVTFAKSSSVVGLLAGVGGIYEAATGLFKLAVIVLDPPAQVVETDAVAALLTPNKGSSL